MPTDGRTQANLPDTAGATMRDRDGVCAAGQAQDSFIYSFRIDRPGHFVAYRGGVNIGGVVFKIGGWSAYERRAGRQHAWTPCGRILAYAAAQDLWGEFSGQQMRFLPENRPAESTAPRDGMATHASNEVRI